MSMFGIGSRSDGLAGPGVLEREWTDLGLERAGLLPELGPATRGWDGHGEVGLWYREW